jgi:hypothetical protein
MKAEELEQLLVLLDWWSVEQPESRSLREWNVVLKVWEMIEDDMDRARLREQEAAPTAAGG